MCIVCKNLYENQPRGARTKGREISKGGGGGGGYGARDRGTVEEGNSAQILPARVPASKSCVCSSNVLLTALFLGVCVCEFPKVRNFKLARSLYHSSSALAVVALTELCWTDKVGPARLGPAPSPLWPFWPPSRRPRASPTLCLHLCIVSRDLLPIFLCVCHCPLMYAFKKKTGQLLTCCCCGRQDLVVIAAICCSGAWAMELAKNKSDAFKRCGGAARGRGIGRRAREQVRH